VYDSSLLGDGSSTAGGGATAGSGTAGITNHGGAGAGGKSTTSAGSSGTPASGGSTEDAGAAGMPEGGDEGGTAGRAMAGGGGSSAGTAGGNVAGAAGNATGGTAGGGGTLGGGGSAGSAVAGGAGASAGAGGAPVATGCAKLSVPLDDSADQAHFVITLPASTDMTTGSISMRIYVAAGTGGAVFNYVQDPSFNYFAVPSATQPLISSIMGWTTVTWDVGAQAASGSINKATIKRVGISVTSAPSTSGWTNPTVIYVDSIAVTTPSVSYMYTLDTTSTVQSAGTNTDPSTSPPVLWFNNGSSDTKAANVTLTWQASCP
jgi:hypothetical protein